MCFKLTPYRKSTKRIQTLQFFLCSTLGFFEIVPFDSCRKQIKANWIHSKLSHYFQHFESMKVKYLYPHTPSRPPPSTHMLTVCMRNKIVCCMCALNLRYIQFKLKCQQHNSPFLSLSHPISFFIFLFSLLLAHFRSFSISTFFLFLSLRVCISIWCGCLSIYLL